MPLGTLDRTPPPFFKQGPSAFTRLMFYAALAVFLMAADGRWNLTQPLRAGLATVLHPVQQVLLAPMRALESISHYASGLEEARDVQQRAERALMAQADRVMRLEQVQIENDRLRALLDLRARTVVPTLAAQVQYDAPDFDEALGLHGLVAVAAHDHAWRHLRSQDGNGNHCRPFAVRPS